jgi:hypothetical protein
VFTEGEKTGDSAIHDADVPALSQSSVFRYCGLCLRSGCVEDIVGEVWPTFI